MCKILVISDVHGRLRDLRWALNNETADAMFYLGDGLYDLNAALELRKEPVPYRVTVRIERREFFGQSNIELFARCTCPVGNRCKHAAALILAARRAGALVEKPRAEILAWARSLQERVSKADAPRKPSAAKEAIFYLCSAWVGDDVEFSLLNLFYALEWVLFAGFALFLWWRLVQDERERIAADAADAAADSKLVRNTRT